MVKRVRSAVKPLLVERNKAWAIEGGRTDADLLDQRNWYVGIAIDTDLEKIYWTQKGHPNPGEGRIFRANLEIPKAPSTVHRTDIEVFLGSLPEPIDLEVDLTNRMIYWTDRGDPPRGNSVNRISLLRKARWIGKENAAEWSRGPLHSRTEDI